MNCRQSRTEKQLLIEPSASEIVGITIGLKKAVSPVCHIKIKVVCATVAVMVNLEYYREMIECNWV